MKKLLSLICVGLKVNFGVSVLWHRLFHERKDLWLVPVLLLSLMGLIPAGILYLRAIEIAYRALAPLHQQSVILLLAILAGQVFVLVFGMYYVMAAFYFSRDVEILLPLPLQPAHVVFAKFVVILTNEYLTLSPFVLPAMVYYGLLSKAGPAYWIRSAIVYALVPIIPLALVSLAILGMMRIVNLGRKKDLLVTIGSVFLLVTAFGFQHLIAQGEGSGDVAGVFRTLAAPGSILNRIGAGFPPSIWAAKAIAEGSSGIFNLILFAGVSALTLAASVWISQKIFYGGLIGLSESPASSQNGSRADLTAMAGQAAHPIKAIFLRELRVMNRTPVFLLNGVVNLILLPLLIAFTSHGGNRKSPLAALTSSDPSLAILVAAGFLTVSACLNGTSSSTFSREGTMFWMSKVIPVSPRQQVAAKFLHSFAVSFVGVVLAAGIAVLVLGLKPGMCALAVVLALVAAFALTAIGMMIDLARPLLDWTNPQKAMKQNLNVLLAVFADLGILASLGWVAKWMLDWHLGPGRLITAFLCMLLALCVGSAWLLLKFAVRRYAEIEP